MNLKIQLDTITTTKIYIIQALSYNVVSSTYRLTGIQTHVSGDSH
jgi:hypothetical protein